MPGRRLTLAAIALVTMAVVAVVAPTPSLGVSESPTRTVAVLATAVPRPDHVVLVMLENKKFAAIAGSASAPYLNSLAATGATFTRSFAVTHPSQPNYLALLSGSTQGVTDDSCPHTFTGENLAHQLLAAGLSFQGYSESMPADGYTGCASGTYARKHNSWVDFGNVPATSNVRFASFPTTFTRLPTVSFVVPDLCDDMHDCPVATGDTWLRTHLDGYAQWARTHNSLLIVTFDEDSNTSVNQIFTVFVGQHVRTGTFREPINHYSVLRTIEDAYGLRPIGGAASRAPITDVWR